MIGIQDTPDFPTIELKFEPNDMVMMITDGMLDNKGNDNSAYNYRKLLERLEESKSPKELKEKIEGDLKDVWQETTIEDDSSYVIFQYKGPSSEISAA